MFHRTGAADGGQQPADDHGRGGCRDGRRGEAEEAAADIGRDRATVVHGRLAAHVPVRADDRGGLLRAADTRRRGRRPGRAAGGRLLRRFRPVRGQRAAADGPAVGDNRQAVDQRGAVPGPDGHAERQHAHRDAAAGQAQERQAGTVAPTPGPTTPLSVGRVDHGPAGRVHGDVVSHVIPAGLARSTRFVPTPRPAPHPPPTRYGLAGSGTSRARAKRFDSPTGRARP